MTLRVRMIPHPISIAGHGESGIKTVVLKYAKYLPHYGIEIVDARDDAFDLMAVHAGMTTLIPNSAPIVAMLHGIYWTSDYPSQQWQHKANRAVIDSIRHASATTVPSQWVAEVLQRDMHLDPFVIGHGIEPDEWAYDGPVADYVIGYAKNRAGMDVCDPTPLATLALQHPKIKFVSTFAPDAATRNIRATGVLPQAEWRQIVQRAKVYVSFVKETFCLGALEAMAAGVPICGYREGGIADFVEHGVTGYLAVPGDKLDLARGLDYCLAYRDTLGHNARLAASRYTWPAIVQRVADVYHYAVGAYGQPHDVTVVIPCYNKGATLERTVNSVLASVLKPREIIIVDNNSTDDSRQIAEHLAARTRGDAVIRVVNASTQGVAHARNHGIALATTRYICCLDADDEIEPHFLTACVDTLKSDLSLGVAYTKLRWIDDRTGNTGVSLWPGEYHYDEFFKRKNQVPTCCVFTKEAWSRAGGYRQRYAPKGAGAEDAEFWLRLGALGFGGKLASDQPLFIYHLGGQVSGNPAYQEPDWLAGHPWVQDRKHPFASVATPDMLAHPVRQYDAPKIAVVIPVGPGHEKHLLDALDSLEAQSFRAWEAIVVIDGEDGRDDDRLRYIIEACPFAHFVIHAERAGAGAARNAGVRCARAPLILFLDADDWLTPDALDILFRTQAETGGIVYSDYIGHAILNDPVELDRLQMSGRLISHDRNTLETVILHNAFDYDCEEALMQPWPTRPRGQFYIWCLISALLPKSYHEEIGGFDESMPSWEDWDYWIRMARAGKCFGRVTHPLVEYRFATGTRRASANPEESGESGRQLSTKLLEYLQAKKEAASPMPCGGCKKAQAPVASPRMAVPRSLNQGNVPEMSADKMVWVRLIDGNIGSHPISFRADNEAVATNYDYRAHGDRFMMLRHHAELDHRVVIEDPPAPAQPEPQTPEPPPAPSLLDETEFATWLEEDQSPAPPSDLDGLWGMNDERKAKLVEAGIITRKQLLGADPAAVGEILGMAPLTVGRLLKSAK